MAGTLGAEPESEVDVLWLSRGNSKTPPAKSKMLRRVRKQQTPHAACAFECVLRVGVYVSVCVIVVVVGAGVG